MVTFVLLSPTYGMHLYTADLARTITGCRLKVEGCGLGVEGCRLKVAGGRLQVEGSGVRVVTTTTAPVGVYGDGVEVLTPVTTHGTGFAREGMNLAAYRDLQSSIFNLQPSTVHFTGVHLWNAPLVHALRRRGARVVHTLHDLAPHSGVRHGGLIRLWNRLVIGSGAEILVHGKCWREQLIREGVDPARVVWAPLLHGFTEKEEGSPPAAERKKENQRLTNEDVKTEIVDRRDVIFFGRMEVYKGVEVLVEAWRRLKVEGWRFEVEGWRLVLAGKMGKGVRLGELPEGVEVRDRAIGDEEALALFGGAALLVLPYRDATQSALIGAAARLGVPSLVTRTGALPEYVVEGETGWVVDPGDPQALVEGLREALGDRERLARFGTAARSWYDAARAEEQHILGQLYFPS